jgi:hypothetical protein
VKLSALGLITFIVINFWIPVVTAAETSTSDPKGVMKNDYDLPDGLAVSDVRRLMASLSQRHSKQPDFFETPEGQKLRLVLQKAILFQMTRCMKKFALKYAKSSESAAYLTEMAYKSCHFWEATAIDALSLGMGFRFHPDAYQMVLDEMKRLTAVAIMDARAKR